MRRNTPIAPTITYMDVRRKSNQNRIQRDEKKLILETKEPNPKRGGRSEFKQKLHVSQKGKRIKNPKIGEAIRNIQPNLKLFRI